MPSADQDPHATDHPTRITLDGHSATLICHMAMLSGRYRRNSMPAISECIDAGADRLEIDVHSLDGDDYAVYHDRRLEQHTTGSGPIGSATPEQVRASHFLDAPDEEVPLLSEVVDYARTGATQVQLDLKDWRLMTEKRTQTLLDVIKPVHDRVIISTGQDWNLRRLHELDRSLALGFDPGHYLDHAAEGAPFFLPRGMGAYGYRDEHPMAIGRTEETPDYLAERMAALAMQAPAAREWFISYRLVLQMLDDGYSPADWLHERGLEVTAWTPDYEDERSLDALRRLLTAGVDRVTTNTIPAWRAAAEPR